MSNIWRFQPRENQMAVEWANTISSQENWSIVKPVGAGESGSFEVVNTNGLVGYAKPAFQQGTNLPRAAHEKIAADLGFLLQIPIPPSVLWEDTLGNLFSISLSAFKQPVTWEQARPMLTNTFLNNLSEALAEGLVFHSWIGDADHNGHQGNIVFDAESDENSPSVAFIDHAFSMTYSWKGVCPTVNTISPYYFNGLNAPSSDHLRQCVNRIKDLKEQEILNLVERIPSPLYLEEDQANIILENLLKRRDDLCRCFGV